VVQEAVSDARLRRDITDASGVVALSCEDADSRFEDDRPLFDRSD
jgi:hypothetical protein